MLTSGQAATCYVGLSLTNSVCHCVSEQAAASPLPTDNARCRAAQRRGGRPQALDNILKMAAKTDSIKTANSLTREQDIADLENWSRDFVDAINARDFSNPVFGLASPTLEGDVVDVFPPTNTPAAHLAKFRQMAEENPEYHMQLPNVRTDLDEGGKWAKVFLTIRATGRPAGLTREALGVLTWRKDESGWCLISHESMRSFSL